MKKLLMLFLVIALLGIPLLACPQSYGSDNFSDEELITVRGDRPLVDIEVSELFVEILPEDFEDGEAIKEVIIYNEGNVPCGLEIEVNGVPHDLDVEAEVDDERLEEGDNTILRIVVKLSEQQEETNFEFTILVIANLER